MLTDPLFILTLLAFPVILFMALDGPELLIEWPLRVTVYRASPRPVTILEMAIYLGCWDVVYLVGWWLVTGGLPAWWILLVMVLMHSWSAIQIGGVWKNQPC